MIAWELVPRLVRVESTHNPRMTIDRAGARCGSRSRSRAPPERRRASGRSAPLMDPYTAGGIAATAALLGMGGTYLIVRKLGKPVNNTKRPGDDYLLADGRGHEL